MMPFAAAIFIALIFFGGKDISDALMSHFDRNSTLRSIKEKTPEIAVWLIGTFFTVFGGIIELLGSVFYLFPFGEIIVIVATAAGEILRSILPCMVFCVLFFNLIVENAHNRSTLKRFMTEWIIILIGSCTASPLGFYGIWRWVMLPLYGIGSFAGNHIVIPITVFMAGMSAFYLWSKKHHNQKDGG